MSAATTAPRREVAGLLVYGVGERITRRLCGAVVGLQMIVVFLGSLVAWAIGKSTGDGGHTAYLIVGLVLTVLCVLASASMRRPWGLTLGWFIQFACLISTVVVPMMGIAGAIFLALWITALYQGRKMDQLTADYLAAQAAEGDQPE